MSYLHFIQQRSELLSCRSTDIRNPTIIGRGITIMKGSSMDPKLKMPTLDIIRCKINDTPHKSSNFKQDKRQEIKEGEN